MINIKEHKKYIDKVASNFFQAYKNDFLGNAMDLKDVKQEAYIIAWETIEKYKDKISEKDLKGYISKSLSWKLNLLRKKAQNYSKLFSSITPENNNDVNEEDFLEYQSIRQHRNPVDYRMLLCDIKHACTEREWVVVYGRLVKGKKFSELVEELHEMGENGDKIRTEQGVRQFYERTIKKLRKKLK
jgi:hypothetical protein